MNARLLFVHALSPLHAGTGQGVGVIDLPIAREKATGLPFLPGSSLKGTLRDQCPDSDPLKEAVFGPPTTNAELHAGSAQFSDQRLLLLPVRSVMGTFAWATSPYILRRFVRDAQDVRTSDLPTDIPAPVNPKRCLVVDQGCALIVPSTQNNAVGVYLEDLDLVAQSQREVTAWADWFKLCLFPRSPDWQKALVERFCVVHDDVMSFLLQTATEITARVSLDAEKKTVKKGGLWYEESLPTETILYGFVASTPVKAKGIENGQLFGLIQQLITEKTLQLGGKATVGRGLCRLTLVEARR